MTLEGIWLDSDFTCPICGDRVEVRIIMDDVKLSGRRVGSTGVSGNTPVIGVDLTPGAFHGKIDHECASVKTSTDD